MKLSEELKQVATRVHYGLDKHERIVLARAAAALEAAEAALLVARAVMDHDEHAESERCMVEVDTALSLLTANQEKQT